MRVIRWFSRNHVAGNYLMLLVVVAGVLTWFQSKKEIFPETSIDTISIVIPYPNATPEEAERGVCIPVEEAIADLPGIKKIRSTASRNVGQVMVEVKTGYRVRDVMSDVKSRVDAIDNFPLEAEPAILEELLLKSPVMSVTLTADTDERTMRQLAEQVRDDLLAYEPGPAQGLREILTRAMRGTPRISQVQITGTRPYEIAIEVAEERLRELGLKLSDIARAVSASTSDLPSGSIRTERGEVILRALGKRYQADDLRDIPLTTSSDGSVVFLGDVAELIDGFEDVDLSSRFDQEDAVVINIYRVGEEDTLELAKLVRSYVAQAKTNLAEGVELAIWNDQSTYLEARLELLGRNMATGLFLVLIVLTLFLRPSLAFLVALGIPVAFAGGLWLMPILGITLNMISLFAFILVLGIIVDDAIVTGENVYTRIQSGEHPSIAAYKGTTEVGVVVTFGVLTTMVAFVPMMTLSGVMGKIFPNIPLVVIPTLAFSLLQSKFVLPSHLALLSPHSAARSSNPLFRLQRRVAQSMVGFVKLVYQPMLNFLLRWRYVTISAFTACLAITAVYVSSGWIPITFMPEIEGDILSAKIELAQGVPFEETLEMVERIETEAMELSRSYENQGENSLIRHMQSTAGGQPFLSAMVPSMASQATHLGEVTLELISSDQRTVSSQELAREWRRRVGEVPGIVELRIQAETATSGSDIEFTLIGNDLAKLTAAADHVKTKFNQIEGVVEVMDSLREGKDELRFRTLSSAGRALGFRLASVAEQVRDAFYGREIQRLQRGRDEVKVMVRYPEEDRRRLSSLESMNVRTPEGDEVPLRQIVEFEPGRGPAAITRTDRQRSIKISADLDGDSNAAQIKSFLVAQVLTKLSTEFPGVRYAFEGEQKDMQDSMRELTMGFGFALLGIYVLIAIPLRSYFQPIIIMAVIPFGIVGAVFGHAVMGIELSLMSMCGIIALAGVVVNGSLVMVDYINREQTALGSIREAAVRAGGARFRAIVLTSLTTFVGIMPMVFESDMQAKFLIPMAVSLGFGILFATVITLLLVPCVYLVMDDIARLATRSTSDRAKPDKPQA